VVPAFNALGMLASFWSNSNRSSIFISLGLYVMFLAPTTLPGRAQTGFAGALLQQANPVSSGNHFMSKILVNNRTLGEWWTFLVSPAVFFLFVVVLLWCVAPSLRLDTSRSSRAWMTFRRRLGLSTVGALVLAVLMGSSVTAQQAKVEIPADAQVDISIDTATASVKMGDKVFYNTVITNKGTVPSRPLAVAMNIVNLNAAGDIVDPEDWSPQRTQYVDSLPAGQSQTMSWRVNAILDGDYLVYMVLIPDPGGKDATSHPVASSGIHLVVEPFTKLNPGGVLPFAIGGPVLLGGMMFLLYRVRRRQIDVGKSEESM
jgi:hypothetical protein